MKERSTIELQKILTLLVLLGAMLVIAHFSNCYELNKLQKQIVTLEALCR